MSGRDIDAEILAANPVSEAEVGGLGMEAVERELRGAIAREPAPATAKRGRDFAFATAAGSTRSSRLPAWPGWFGKAQIGLAAAAAGAVLLVVAGTGGDSVGGPAAALGADVAPLVEASPPILLDAPGWRVERADESFMTEGSIQFFQGERGVSAGIEEGQAGEALQRFVEVQWSSSESVGSRIRQLKSLPSRMPKLEAEHPGWEMAPYLVEEVGEAPVLGTTARILAHAEPGESFFEATAVWAQGGQVLELRSFVPDLQAFEQRLAALRRVDAQTWLGALQGKVVRHRHGIAVVNR